MLESFGHVNIFAVIVAAISAFAVGGLWYSPKMFGKAWMEEMGFTEEDTPKNMGQVFALSFVFSLVAAFVFAWHLGPNPDVRYAVSSGILIGLAYVGMSYGINYQFGQKSARLWLIDMLYHTVQFMIYGLVLGLWH